MRYQPLFVSALYLLFANCALGKNLCDVQVAGKTDEAVSLSISHKGNLVILSRHDLGEKPSIQYDVKSGQLEKAGKRIDAISVDYGSTVYVADGNIRGCVIKPEKRDDRKVLYVEELFHPSKTGPRIETQIVELE